MDKPHQPSRQSRLLTLAGLVVVIASLYFARELLIPLALAILISFLLTPLVTRLQHLGLPRIPAVIVVTLSSLLAVVAFGVLVTSQATDLTTQLPQYRFNIERRVQTLRSSFGRSRIAEATEAVKTVSEQLAPASGPASNKAEATPVTVINDDTPLQSLITALSPIAKALATAGLVIVFVIFFLVQREDLRDRVLRLVGDARINITTQALDDAAARVSRYLLMQSVINGLQGALIGVGLWLMGLPNAALWGLLAALLRFIPYLGPWLAASMPVILSLALFESWTRPVMITMYLILVELFTNSVLEPWLYGSHTGLSPVAVIVSAFFWTWLWGPIGLILATPLTVCIRVMGKYVPQLEFLGVILGDEPALKPTVRLYQRLLALDSDEAMDIVDEQMKDKTLQETFDLLVLPALAQVEHDRHRGLIDDPRQEFIRRGLREMIEDLFQKAISEKKELQAAGAHERLSSVTILCVAARDASDDLANLMISELLALAGMKVIQLSSASLAAELLETIEKEQPDCVVISALPPGALLHVRYLCKRISALHMDLPVVVGLWDTDADAERTGRRVGCSSVSVTTTLDAAMTRVLELAHTIALQRSEPAPGLRPVSA